MNSKKSFTTWFPVSVSVFDSSRDHDNRMATAWHVWETHAKHFKTTINLIVLMMSFLECQVCFNCIPYYIVFKYTKLEYFILCYCQ